MFTIELTEKELAMICIGLGDFQERTEHRYGSAVLDPRDGYLSDPSVIQKRYNDIKALADRLEAIHRANLKS